MPGFLASAFLIGGPRTVFSLSIWDNMDAIPRFGTAAPAHVDAARRSMGRVRMADGPMIWSTKWQLSSASNNLNWDAVDFTSFVTMSDDRSALT